jgi:hypothetical protein
MSFTFVPNLRLHGVERIIVQQMAVGLQMRAAAASVGDDGIERIEIEAVDLPAGEFSGQFELAIVRVQGAAAALRARRDDLTAVGEQHIRRVAIDVREGEILDAAREQAHAAPLPCGRRFHGQDDVIRELRRDLRRLRLQASPSDRGMRPKKRTLRISLSSPVL